MSEKIINLDVVSDKLTGAVIDSAFYVHKQLGPGLLESAYEECLSITLLRRGIAHKRQVLMPINFDGQSIENAYRLDFLIENELIVEIKSCEKLLPIHDAQLMTYLKLSGIKRGLLMNFNSKLIKDGLKRIVL